MIATQTFPHGCFIACLILFLTFFTVIRVKWLRILYEYGLLLHNTIVSAFILLIDILFTIVVGLYAVGIFGKETLGLFKPIAIRGDGGGGSTGCGCRFWADGSSSGVCTI